jgi:hypothetical protein
LSRSKLHRRVPGTRNQEQTMSYDRLGVLRYPVNVTPVRGRELEALKSHVATMEREARHLLTAVTDLKNSLNRNDNRLLTDAVMNSRNWSLSVVMSHCFVQSMLGANASNASSPGMATAQPRFQNELLFGRAVKAGIRDGTFLLTGLTGSD